MPALQDILDFYVDAGVDCALVDAPVDRFAESETQKSTQSSGPSIRPAVNPATNIPATGNSPLQGQRTNAAAGTQNAGPNMLRPNQAAPGHATLPDESVIAQAEELAAGAETLDALREAILGFDGCNLKSTASNTVLWAGPTDARIVFVGEAPSRDEDVSGEPFTGKGGQLLEAMLASIGLTRDEVFLTNIMPWRPPGSRQPRPVENAICMPFIKRQLELVQPEFIVPMGAGAAKAFTGSKATVLKLRGQWFEHSIGSEDKTAHVLPMLHPEYLIKQQPQKRLAWQDLLTLKRKLK